MDSDPIPPPPDSPFAREPEQPRLGIIHLMVWTTCAAVYFSLISTLRRAFESPDDGVDIALWVAYGLGSSAALGGLPLAASRRWRGLPYPGQPGETLLLLLGVGAATNMLGYLLVMLAYSDDWSDSGISTGLYVGFTCCNVLFLGVLYLIAVVRTKSLRWRLFFVAKPLVVVITYVLPVAITSFFATMRWYAIFSHGPEILLSAFLVGIAAKDFREHVLTRVQYRWTHWLGIAVQLWSGAVLIVYAIWSTLFHGLL